MTDLIEVTTLKRPTLLRAMSPEDADKVIARIKHILADGRYPARLKIWLLFKLLEHLDVSEGA